MMNRKLTSIYALLFVLACTGAAYAIPPPSVVVNVGITLLEAFFVILSLFSQGFLILLGKKKPLPVKKYRFPTTAVLMLAIAALLGLLIYSGVESKKRRFYNKSRALFKTKGAFATINELKNRGVDLPQADELMKYEPRHSTALKDVADQVFSHETVFIDIRDPRNYKAVTITNAVNVPADKLHEEIGKYRHKKIILFHNGFRISGYLADRLAEQGYDARSLNPGLQKYARFGNGFFVYAQRAENYTYMSRFFRPSQRWKWSVTHGKLNRLDLYDFYETMMSRRSTYKLWDTRDIRDFWSKSRIGIIDVRLDKRLPRDAIPIPVGNLTIRQVEDRIRRLSMDKPYIIVCDDMTTGFEAAWLGAEMERMGYRYLGRYTTPFDYFNLPFKNRIRNYSADTLAKWIKIAIEYLGVQTCFMLNLTQWQHRVYVLTLGFFVFMILFRFTLLPLSLMSQRRRLDAADKIRRLQDTGSPTVNLIQRLNAIRKTGSDNPFMKILKVAPDILIILVSILIGFFIDDREIYLVPFVMNVTVPYAPLGAALFFAYYLYEMDNPLFAGAKKSKWLRWGPTASSLILGTLGAFVFPAIFTACLLINALINVAEMKILMLFRGKKGEVKPETGKQEQKSGITTIGRVRASNSGKKADSLIRMSKQGVNTEKGFVISGELLKDGAVDDDLENRILKEWDRLGIQRGVVRSSCCGEDVPGKTMAGLFRSVLNVDKAGLVDAIKEVLDSYKNPDVCKIIGQEGCPVFGGVIVQEMAEADYHGVLFTETPGRPLTASMDVFDGAPTEEASDRTPLNVMMGRASGRVLSDVDLGDNMPLSDILNVGMELERLFKCPQDVEWAVEKGGVVILQSRNAAVVEPRMAEEILEEKYRLVGLMQEDGFNLTTNEFTEALPFPTESSLSLYRKMFSKSGPFRDACNALALGFAPDDFNDSLMTAFGRLYMKSSYKVAGVEEIANKIVNRFIIDKVIKDAVEGDAFAFEDRDMKGSADFADLTAAELNQELDKVLDGFLKGHIPDVFILNVLVKHRYHLVIQKSGETPPLNSVSSSGSNDTGMNAFCVFELSQPRFDEVYDLNTRVDEQGEAADTKDQPCGDAALNTLLQKREQYRKGTITFLYQLRRIIKEAGVKLSVGDDVFHLRIDELKNALANGVDRETLDMIQRRKKRRAMFEKIEPASGISIPDVERAGLGAVSLKTRDAGDLKGIMASGRNMVTGVVRVISKMEDTKALKEGEIAVAGSASPGLAVLFPKINALVTEGGGILSHLAILARERGVPYVCGCRDATRLENGVKVRLNPDGRVEVNPAE